MRIGFVIGADGRVKRSWTLSSGECAVPVEDGDEIIECAVDHGERLTDPIAKQAKIDACCEIQETMTQRRDRAAVLQFVRALGTAYGHRRVQLQTSGSTGRVAANQEIMYRSDGMITTRQKDKKIFPVDRLSQATLMMLEEG